MSWASFHGQSENFAAAAHEAMQLGNLSRATELFAKAAAAEAEAFASASPDKPRTLGITAVSAVALWYKAGNLHEAEQLAYSAAANPVMPAFAKEELRELLQAVWNEQAQKTAGVSFMPGQVVVSVKGGEVVTGGAPLDLILNKVQIVQSIFYRTAEFLQSLPLRRHGLPSKELQESCRPWLFQSVPGSYQFAVAIQKPRQAELFPTGAPEPEVLTETFLSILKAAGEDPTEALKTVVPDDDYRSTFLKMTRNLAPTGKVVEQIEIRAAGDRNAVVLSAQSRKLISETLRPPRAVASPAQVPEPETILRGILRALDLDHDWLEVSVDGVHKRITGVGETVDDVIGPMVNREVNVKVRPGRGSALLFIDIEQEE
jgi:hypothetical protein